MAIQEKTFNSQLPDLLTQFLGNKTTTGSTTTSSSGANIAPLQQVFSQASQPMDMAMYEALIGDIYNTAARQVPELTAALANATGSRSSNNSPLALAIADLQAKAGQAGAQQILNFNTNQQQIAGNAARGIADSTRTQTQTSNQQQKQGSAVNPLVPTVVGWGLNQLDKRGIFDKAGDVIGSGLDAVNSIFSSPTNYGSALESLDPFFGGGAWDATANFASPDVSNFADPSIFGGAGGGDWMGDLGQWAGDAIGGAVDAVGDWGSDIIDTVGGWFGFANGGPVNTQAGGLIPARMRAPMQVADHAAMGGDPNQMMQMLLMQAMMPQQVQAPQPNPINFLRYLLPTSGFNIYQYANGGTVGGGPRRQPAGYADGGMVRNRNYMGGPQQREGQNIIDTSSFVGAGGGGANLSSSTLMSTMAMQQEQRERMRQQEEQFRLMNAGTQGPSAAAAVGTPSQNAAVADAFVGALIGTITAAITGPAAPAVNSALNQIGIPANSPLAFIASMVSNSTSTPGTGSDGGSSATDGSASEGAVSSPVADQGIEGFSLGPAAGEGAGEGATSADGIGVGVGDAASSATGGTDGVGAGGDSASGAGVWKNGGKIIGPGTGTSDSIRAKSRVPGEMPVSFSNGEFIFSKKAVDFYGEDLLTSMLMKAHTPV